MIGITCSKCGRRFTPSAEDVEGYIAQGQGKKHVQVVCPHCNYGNKIAVDRLQQSVHHPAGQHAQPQSGQREAEQPDVES